MKKLFVMAAAVSVALTGCTSDKADVGYIGDAQQKITFSNPVVGAATRAVPGEINTTRKYPTNQKFIVSAQWDKTAYSEWGATESKVYMNNVVVSHQATPASNGAWYPATDYYWPREGVLSFWAASPATELAGKVSYDKTNLIQIGEITIPDNGYTKAQGTTDAEVASTQYDLMYAPIVTNQTKSTTTDNDTQYNGVDLAFKHALSLVKFDIALSEAYTGTTIKIKEIKIVGLKNHSSGFSESTKAWQTPDGSATYEVANYPTGKLLANTPAIDVYEDSDINGKRLILMPQTIEDNIATKIVITYSMQSTGGEEFDQTVETKLYNAGLTEWEAGKAYTYHLKLALDKIYFDPVVEDWTAGKEQEIIVPQA